MFWWNWWASVSLTLVTLLAVLERFPLGKNRDSQWARKREVSADDSVSGMRFAAGIGQFVRRLSAEACAKFFTHAGYAAT